VVAALSTRRSACLNRLYDTRPLYDGGEVHVHVSLGSYDVGEGVHLGAPTINRTCLVFDGRDQEEITYITPTLERQDPIGLDVHIQHVVPSIYSMQQSTVWWTREVYK
jgi:hypothetical protein